MINVTNRRRALAASASMLVGLAALAGCGADNSTSSNAGLPESSGAMAVERQFVQVVDRVSPQVVQIQTNQGLGSGIVYDDRGDIVTNAHVASGATVDFVRQGRRWLLSFSDGNDPLPALAGTT